MLGSSMNMPFGSWTEYPTPGPLDPGRPLFGRDIKSAVYKAAVVDNRNALVISSFHFSKSNPHLGCKAFGYDAEKSVRNMNWQNQRLAQLWEDEKSVATIIVGLETDTHDLVFVGDDLANQVTASSMVDMADDQRQDVLRGVYPSLRQVFIEELAFFVAENLKYQEKRKEAHAAIEQLDHQEIVLSYGTAAHGLGFHVNSALAIGPYGDYPTGHIAIAGGILNANWESGRTSRDQGILLLATTFCSKSGFHADVMQAEFEARYFANQMFHALSGDEKGQELLADKGCKFLVAVVDSETYGWREIEWDPNRSSAEVDVMSPLDNYVEQELTAVHPVGKKW
ncbi:MAG TPA: hypothetical protein VLA04_06475 [Verrucomicrobiae bacterium]|nr:hypothetical protein [Verrucomicrobiae bacterium]